MGRRSPELYLPDQSQAEWSLPADERCLTEVDNLNRHRLPDGSHAPWVLAEIFKNLVPYIKEGGMPNAVHTDDHPYEMAAGGLWTYMWLGQTALQVAQSGRAFHRHPNALQRVGVEEDEARDNEANLRPGFVKIFVSPRMSRADATYEEARAEHLADDDSIRCSYAITDEQGKIAKKRVESLLVRDIPLEAWVAMLADPANIFGRAIDIEDPDSALSVMKTHKQLELPADQLPEGVVSVVAAVVPYIQEAGLQASVERQLERFREDQTVVQAKAANLAQRWLDFEVALADSLYEGVANQAVSSFIISMQDKWNKADRAVILEHQLPDAQFEMTRQLAKVVEKAKKTLFLIKASVVAGNERVLEQLDAKVAKEIYRREITVQTAYASGSRPAQIMSLEAEQDRQIASQKVRGGGGCAGETETDFEDDLTTGMTGGSSRKFNSRENRTGKVSRGCCVVKACPTRPKEVKVGGCGVCLERCQKLFDAGKDPTKMRRVTTTAGRQAVGLAMRADSHEFGLAA